MQNELEVYLCVLQDMCTVFFASNAISRPTQCSLCALAQICMCSGQTPPDVRLQLSVRLCSYSRWVTQRTQLAVEKQLNGNILEVEVVHVWLRTQNVKFS